MGILKNVLSKVSSKLKEIEPKVQQELKRPDPAMYEDWKPKAPTIAQVATKPVPPPPPAPAPSAGARPSGPTLFKDAKANMEVSGLREDLNLGRITQQQYNQKIAELQKKYAVA